MVSRNESHVCARALQCSAAVLGQEADQEPRSPPARRRGHRGRFHNQLQDHAQPVQRAILVYHACPDGKAWLHDKVQTRVGRAAAPGGLDGRHPRRRPAASASTLGRRFDSLVQSSLRLLDGDPRCRRLRLGVGQLPRRQRGCGFRQSRLGRGDVRFDQLPRGLGGL
jgi:hypothetical protein